MQYFRRGSSLILLLANKRSFKVLFLGSGIHLMEDPNLKETRWIDLTAYPKFLMKIERVWIIMLIAWSFLPVSLVSLARELSIARTRLEGGTLLEVTDICWFKSY